MWLLAISLVWRNPDVGEILHGPRGSWNRARLHGVMTRINMSKEDIRNPLVPSVDGEQTWLLSSLLIRDTNSNFHQFAAGRWPTVWRGTEVSSGKNAPTLAATSTSRKGTSSRLPDGQMQRCGPLRDNEEQRKDYVPSEVASEDLWSTCRVHFLDGERFPEENGEPCLYRCTSIYARQINTMTIFSNRRL